MNTKLIPSSFSLAMVALALAFGGAAAAADQPVIGLITKTETNPFFVKMKEGAQAAATAKGVKLLSAAGKADGDNAGQMTAIENMIAGTMAFESLGVIRVVLAPAAIMFSMAVTWPALSPSALPAALSSFTPLAVAAACAPSFIFTKKGLVSVFVIRPITGWSAATAAPPKARATTANEKLDRESFVFISVSPEV